MTRITVTVDGVEYSDDIEPRTLLVHYLRQNLGKTGTVVGCDTSNCGACTVHLDGRSVKSCNMLAVQADGHEVTTIEGLASDGQLHPMQQAFHECHALQCGYCTPGMIMQACDLLKDNPDPSEQEIREGLEGNLCRCTGYHNIVRAVHQAAEAMRKGTEAPTDSAVPAEGATAPEPAAAGVGSGGPEMPPGEGDPVNAGSTGEGVTA
jgi:carbon-monoxide dehydrogenase small subunit